MCFYRLLVDLVFDFCDIYTKIVILGFVQSFLANSDYGKDLHPGMCCCRNSFPYCRPSWIMALFCNYGRMLCDGCPRFGGQAERMTICTTDRAIGNILDAIAWRSVV